MHPFSPALTAEIERKAALWRLSNPSGTNAAEWERAIWQGLRDLRLSRPRLVEFAPKEALQRVLQGHTVPAYFNRPRARQKHFGRRTAGQTSGGAIGSAAAVMSWST